MKKNIITLLLLIAFFNIYAADEKNEVQANLTSVTVYRSGAEMTHNVSAILKAGNNQLIINNISNAVDSNSIQIKAPSSVTILGFEFSKNYLVSTTKTQRRQQLDDSLQQVQNNIDKLQLSITNARELLDVLKMNRDIKGEQNGLSVSELEKLMDYYDSKSTELQNTIAQLTEKKNKSIVLADKIKEQINEEDKKNISTAGRLTLELNAAMPLKADFIISYIARFAYCQPFYDMRADNIQLPLKIFYKAKIVQTTGIDWKQVKLSLSTATPSQKGNAPELQAWFLGYINYYSRNELNGSLAGKIAGIQMRDATNLNEVVVVGYGTAKKDAITGSAAAPKPVYVVNGSVVSEEAFQQINPNSIKSIDHLKPAAAKNIYGSVAEGGAAVVQLKEGLQDYIAVTDKTLNVNFDIDIPFDVPTSGKEQTATLQIIDAGTAYEHVAIPKMDNDVYLIAKLQNWERLNLLPGEANIIMEGTYVGKTYINPEKTSDSLNITLGNDRRVVINRKKLEDFSSVKFFGSNKLQKFTYEIVVKNNKKEAVNIVVKDQYPLSTNKDIEVELNETSGAVADKDNGSLMWQLKLEPNESKTFRFSYTVKYPKDKTINIY
jgi:hypothetical protein